MNNEIKTKAETFIIAYHANCIDGFTSAWVVAKWAQKLELTFTLLPMHYGAEDGDEAKLLELLATHEERTHLYIVDFSVSIDCLSKIQSEHANVDTTILDHHKTAFERYAGFAPDEDKSAWTGKVEGALVFLDNNLSGAGVCWDYLFTGQQFPKLVCYVQDYDLWKFTYGDATKQINQVLKHLNKSLDVWDRIASQLEEHQSHMKLLWEGEQLIEKHNTTVASIAAKAVPITWLGYAVGYFVACPKDYTSDVGHTLAKRSGAFGLMYNVSTSTNTINYSLRSEGDFDVSEIAKDFGGGGHKNAAGFSTPLLAPNVAELFSL
jgi:oligoribonuclease NrnB/cAMP/cGMP phosphodiesterase (DHH superfamily)